MGMAKGTQGATSCYVQLVRVPRGEAGKGEKDGSSSAPIAELTCGSKSLL